MSTVNYLSKSEMKSKFGMDALGYTEDGNIYIQKGLDKNTENIVRAHEAEHVRNGENGPFLGAIADFLGLSGDTSAPGEAANIQAGAIGEAAALQDKSFQQIIAMLQEQMGTTAGSFDPFIQAGVGALPDLQRGFQAPEGTTAGGLENVINEIMGGEAFGGLVEERQRGVQGQLAAGGLTRSGTAIKEAAAIPTDLAFNIENLLTGRQFGAEQQRISVLQNLVSGGQAATGAQAGASGNMLANLMNAITGKASAAGGALTGAAEAQASGILGGAQQQQQGVSNLLGLGSLFAFSDPRLKKNIKYIGKSGPLDLVEWEWKDELDGTIVSKFPTMGYLSTQVKEFYPEHVHEFGGYDVIDYPAVNEKILCH